MWINWIASAGYLLLLLLLLLLTGCLLTDELLVNTNESLLCHFLHLFSRPALLPFTAFFITFLLFLLNEFVLILDPEIIEVVGVSVEFESFFLVFPIRSELIQVRRGITRPVHFLKGKWQRATIKNLLILNTITLEVVLETKFLNPHISFHSGVQLGSLLIENLDTLIEGGRTLVEVVGLTDQITKKVLSVFRERTELLDNASKRVYHHSL